MADGNIAAMREAIGKALWCLNWMDENTDDKSIKDHLAKPIELLTAALAAPPRNCDVGTAEEQYERYDNFACRYNPCSFRGDVRCAEDCPVHKKLTREGHGELLCQLEWAQMPYEAEGGEEQCTR